VIDKKISMGTIITVATILGTFIYTQGILTSKIEAFQEEDKEHSIKMNKNKEDIIELQIAVGKIETKIDEGFKRIEDLFIEN
jgi:hypothetical protein